MQGNKLPVHPVIRPEPGGEEDSDEDHAKVASQMNPLCMSCMGLSMSCIFHATGPVLGSFFSTMMCDPSLRCPLCGLPLVLCSGDITQPARTRQLANFGSC